MLKAVIRFSVRQRFLAVLLALAVVGTGVWSFTKLPIDAVPDVTNKQVQINTSVTGLSPEEIEKQITFPIEWAMQGIPGVEQVRSVSFYGVSQTSVIFADDVDIYRARQLVSERLAEAKESLPPTAGTPFLGPIWTGLGEIFFWTLEVKGPKADGTPYSLTDLRTIQDWIVRPQLRGIPGITEINAIGGFERQYLVAPDPHKLIAYGLSFRDLVGALESNNLNVGGGYIEHLGELYTIRSTAQIASLDDIRNIKVGVHEGVPFSVKDIAEVSLGEDLRTGAGTVDGKEAIVGTAILLYEENSRVVSRRVAAKLAEVNKTLPVNVSVRTLYDRTYLVDATLDTVKKNLFEGAVLVIAVLFLLLGNLRAALIVAAAIPLSMLFAVTGMVQNKISANLMSLGAIDFGIIVDGTVVLVENILRRLSQHQKAVARVLTHKERLRVVRDATVEVSRPTLFGVAIIMIVYLPILTLGGVEGKMFKPMAQVVLLALAGALTYTFVVVPALVALLVRGRIHEKEPRVMGWAKTVYSPLLAFSLHCKYLVVFAALVMLVISAYFALFIGSEFIPKLGEGALALQPTRMPSIALSSSVAMQEKVEQALLREFPNEIETIFARTGTSEVVTDVCGTEVSDTYIVLRPQEEWRRASTQVELAEAMEQVVEKLPGQNYEFSQPIELRMNELIAGVRSDLAIKVYGENMDIMMKLAGQIAKILSSIPGAEDVKIEQTAGMPMISISVDRGALARYGLSAQEVQEVIAIALGGQEAGQILEGDRRFDLVVRLPERLRGEIDAINYLPIAIPFAEGAEDTGPGYIPLSSVARIELVEGLKQIRREDGKRRVVVTANVRGRDLGSFVADAQRDILSKIEGLPEGYWLGWGGQFENLIGAKNRLLIVVPLAFSLILLMLVAHFGTLRHALLVFTGVPFALTGGVFALWLRDIPFSISAGVGFIALSGVAVLNGLVLVTFIKHLRASGTPIKEAIIEGCTTRLRPVLMTALVASLGFVPMAIAVGMGAEVQRPLATVVIGGIISSTLLTLLVLPALYLIIEKRLFHRG